tara:strand:- start:22232 stop:26953 length:4722 start_codon:yes stop_codon:yes gene_type:complete
MSNSKIVNIVEVLNPFDIAERDIRTEDWSPEKYIFDYIPEGDFAVSVNGRVLDEDEIVLFIPKPDDSLIFCPIPRGGDGGSKDILRMAAMLALSASTGFLATNLLGVGSASAGFAAAKMGVMLVGAALIHNLIPMEQPQVDSTEDSPTYGIDGPKQTSSEMIPVPLCFGEHRMAGNVIARYNENDSQTQFLYTLINAGEGEIGVIDASTILINEQPISNFDIDIATDIVQRPGTQDQDAIEWFDDVHISQNINLEVIDTDYVLHTTINDVDRIRVDFVAPAGLQNYHDDGSRHSVTVPVTVEYRKVGDVTWLGPIIDSSGFPTVITGKSTSAVRTSFYSPYILPANRGKYEIRVQRTSPILSDEPGLSVADTVNVADIIEIQRGDVNYVNTAVLGVKIRLTDQLNAVPNITFLHPGIKVPVYNGATWTTELNKNPAWLTFEMLTNTRWGGSYDISRLDIRKWSDWAEFCVDNNLLFNGVIDTESSLWEAIQRVARVGRASVIRRGTKFDMVIERPDVPTMMFSMANIVADSFSEKWTPLESRANEVEVTFSDAADNYKQRAIKIVDQAAFDAGQKQKSSTLTLYGIVDADRAYDEAVLLLNMNRYIQRTASFSANVDAIACLLGDVIYIQHDMPQWGFGGRLETGSTDLVLQLDKPIDFEVAEAYKILVHYSSLHMSAYDGTVVSLGGTTGLQLSGITTETDFKRIVFPGLGGLELEIVDKFGSSGVIEVTSNVGISALDAYELYDTDVMLERDLVNTEDSTSTVTTTLALTSAPAALTQWMIGKVGKYKKPFRVQSISKDSTYTRQIDVVEYNEAVYSPNLDIVPTPNYSNLTEVIEHVTILEVEETLSIIGDVIATSAKVYWVEASSVYRDAEVYITVNGGASKFMGTGINSFSFSVATGDILVITIVARDAVGGKAAFSTAPTFNHTVIGKSAPPANVQGLAARRVDGGIVISWDANTDVDIAGYEVRKGISWDGGTVISSGLRGTTLRDEGVVAGIVNYFVSAIDTSKIYSLSASAVSLTLAVPLDVRGFFVVQSGNQVNFKWSANPTADLIDFYEIREGLNWSSGRYIARSSGTGTFATLNTSDSSKTFWIKAYDASGLSSASANFASAEVITLDNRNAVYTEDHRALGWPGTKTNTIVTIDDSLKLDAGALCGEYIYILSLPQSYRGRSLYEAEYNVLTGAITWAEATFAWNSVNANRAWQVEGDVDTVSISEQIALPETVFEADIIQRFPLSAGTLGTTSIEGVLEATSLAKLYITQSAWENFVTDSLGFTGTTGYVQWTTSTPVEFGATIVMYKGPTLPAESWEAQVWSFKNLVTELRVVMDKANDQFRLDVYDIGTTTVIESVIVPFEISELEDYYTIGITQDATSKHLFVHAKWSDKTVTESIVSAPSASPYTSVRIEALFSDAIYKTISFSNMILRNLPMDEVTFNNVAAYGYWVSSGYGYYQEFIIGGDYEFQLAAMRVSLRTLATSDVPQITQLKHTIDLPDVLERGTAVVTNAAAGIAITFAREFNSPPEFVAIMSGGAVFGVVRYVDGTLTDLGVTARIYNASNVAILGTISWTAMGN